MEREEGRGERVGEVERKGGGEGRERGRGGEGRRERDGRESERQETGRGGVVEGGS